MQMTTWIGFLTLSTMILPATLAAQSSQSPLPAIPPESGVYYQTNAGWVPVRGTVLLPFLDGQLKNLLGFGSRDAVVRMPGQFATMRITNARPTFCIRGFSPETGLYLVRGTQKQNYREVRAKVSGDMTQWDVFQSKDLTALEVEPIDANVVRVKPRADLKPGEYVLVSDLESRYRAIHLGFEFGFATANSQ